MFVIDVGLRRDGKLTEQKYSLILRLVFALFVAIGLALNRGVLQVRSDQ